MKKLTTSNSLLNQKAIPFVIYENNKFIIPEEAKALLENDSYRNIGIMSLVGKYRTGKSFLLNRVILNQKANKGFGVGQTFKPCTKGIWIWSEPLYITNNHCNETFPCFLIDTEGLCAYDEDINHDSKIFLISTLISSLFIFNSFGAIDENAIHNLSFVLNLSKTIKLRNDTSCTTNVNENNDNNELSDYFPSLLWLLRDFHLKLEDTTGHDISEKQYLERSLQNIKGSTDSIEEKNKVRTMIRTYFPERDCFTIVRPVENEIDLQNLQNLDDNQLRSEFVIQAKEFRESVVQKVKPKMFMNKTLTGSMLIELVQSVLNAINHGDIPIIENSWKYVIQSETIKNSNQLIDKFKLELDSFNDSNQSSNSSNYIKERSKFTKKIFHKYISQFESNPLLDKKTKEFYIQKFKLKLNSEIDIFNQESELLIEKDFIKSIDDQSKFFIDSFTNNNKYSYRTYYLFYQDIETFISKCEETSSPFPNRPQIILDKILIIIKKFIDIYLIKPNNQSEKEISTYKTALVKLQQKFKANNDELIKYKEEHSSHLERINNSIVQEKFKQKNYEDKIQVLLNEKKIERERYERNISQMKMDYNKNYERTFNSNSQSINELKIKSEQINIIKANNQKINSINDQKILFLDQELNIMKEKYTSIFNEFKIKENSLLIEIASLKTQNSNLLNENTKSRKKSSESINISVSNLELILKDHLQIQSKENKYILERFMNSKQIQRNNFNKINNEYQNDQEINEEKMKLIENLSEIKEINRGLKEKLNKMMCYNDIIRNTIGFKCRSCLRVFALEQFKVHFRNCQMNFPLTSRDNSVNNKSFNNGLNKSNSNKTINHIQYNNTDSKLKIRIIKDKVIQDEFGKHYLEYVIHIEYNNQSWLVNKQFNQFVSFYKSLKTLYDDVLNLPFSSDRFINVNDIYTNTNSNTIDGSNENTISQLNRFFIDIANIEVINQSKLFRRFFEFERCNNNEIESAFLFSTSRNNEIDIINERDYKGIDDRKEYNKENSIYFNNQREDNDYDCFYYDIINH